MIGTIVSAILPVAVIIVLGYAAGVRGWIDRSHTDGFVAFVLNFSVPALLFFITATADLDTLFNGQDVVVFTIAIMGMFAFSYGLHALLLKRATKEAAQGAFVCSFPDMVFLGIPLITVLVDSGAVVSVAIGNIITSVLLIPMVVILLELRADGERGALAVLSGNLRTVFSKPQVVAPILGVLVAALGIDLPEPVRHGLKLLMDTTAGVSLFALGLIISSYTIIVTRVVILNAVLKNLVHPTLAIALVLAFGLSDKLSMEIILLCAMPTATITTMFAIRYEVLTEESTSSTLLGTILAIVTLPLFMFIVGSMS